MNTEANCGGSHAYDTVEDLMHTTSIIRSLMIALALVVIPTFVALAIEREPGTGIPEILQQSALV